VKNSHKKVSPKTIAVAASLAALQMGSAWAQNAQTQDGLKLDEIVVTATPEARSKMKQSLSVSSIDAEQISNSGATTSAEILRSIPGIRSEAGAENNSNVTVRGVPISAGGARYVQFQEDGLPVLLWGDFNFVTPDMLLRADLGTDGVEVVRGGSASTMATNSPAGVINFISKTGETAQKSVAVTTNVGGADQKRYEFAYGKPSGTDSTFFISGFIRDGEGPRKTHGVNVEGGGQLRAVFTKDLGQGNNIKIFTKFLNDKTPISMPVPVNIVNGQIVSLPGVDPRTFSPYSSNLPNIGAQGVWGSSSNINDGMHIKSTSIGGEVNLNIGNGWKLNDKFRVAQNSGSFNGILPHHYANAATPAAGATTYNPLLLQTALKDIGVSINDIKASKTFSLQDGAQLTTSYGLFTGSQKYVTDWEIGQFAASSLTGSSYGTYSSNVYKRGVNNTYNVMSPYAAVGWAKDKWNVDASIRQDQLTTTGSWQDSGGTRGIDYTSKLNSYSVGVNYSVDRNFGVFARVSEGGALPGERGLSGNTNYVGSRLPHTVNQIEGGVKWRNGNFSSFVTVFEAKTSESNYDVTTRVSSANDYKASGVEVETAYRSGGFRIAGGLTLTDAEVTKSNTAAYVGKAPNRQARTIYQLSPSYKLEKTTVGLSIVGTTSAKDAQTTALETTLPGYTYANAFVKYDYDKSTVLSLSVNNLTNTLGFTEANAERAAARAINGRTVRATLRYNF
jgi:outer membrane receptor protein involved in Fe transport